MGLAINDLVRKGELQAPIVIGRDHLDCGSVASPNRETESMKDGTDAVARYTPVGFPFWGERYGQASPIVFAIKAPLQRAGGPWWFSCPQFCRACDKKRGSEDMSSFHVAVLT